LSQLTVFALPSVGTETTLSADLAPVPGWCRLGRKNDVRHIVSRPAAGGKETVFTISPVAGEDLVLTADRAAADTFVAGSAWNWARALSSLGATSIGVSGPVASVSDKRMFIDEARRRSFTPHLFCGGAMATTLNVRDPAGRGSTLFCVREPYRVPVTVRAELLSARAKILLLGSLRPHDLELAQMIVGAGNADEVVIVANEELLSAAYWPMLGNLLTRATVFQMNHVEAERLVGGPLNRDRIRGLNRLGPKIVIVTLDKDGTVLVERGQEPIFQPSFPVRQVDDCGAGDAHLAAFVYYHLLHPVLLPLSVCLKMAVWIAGRTVEHVGPVNGIPGQEEREAQLRHFLS